MTEKDAQYLIDLEIKVKILEGDVGFLNRKAASLQIYNQELQDRIKTLESERSPLTNWTLPLNICQQLNATLRLRIQELEDEIAKLQIENTMRRTNA